MIIEEKTEEVKEQNENEVVAEEEAKSTESNKETKKETEVSAASEIEKSKKDSEEDEEEKKGRLQKRIDSLVRRANEAERMAEQAVEYAKKINAEREKERTERISYAETTVKSQLGEANARMDFYKKQFKDAFESGDAEKAADAQAKMAELAVEKSQANAFSERIKQEKQSRDTVLEKMGEADELDEKTIPRPSRNNTSVSPLALDWHKRNQWYGTDESLSAVALVENRKLLNEGYDENSPEFYDELDKRISRFKPAERAVRPQAVVSGGKRAAATNAQRDLSTEQKRLIARLGISEKDYREQMQLMEKS